eukprot:3659379-Pleurochrysis_carterae.AAC.3
MEKEPSATSRLAPPLRLQPALVPAKAAAAMAKADMAYASETTTFATPLYAPDPPAPKFSETGHSGSQDYNREGLCTRSGGAPWASRDGVRACVEAWASGGVVIRNENI